MKQFGLGEFHRFDAAGQPFAYLVPSAAVFALDPPSIAVLGALDGGPRSRDELVSQLSDEHSADAVDGALEELMEVRAVRPIRPPTEPETRPPTIIPLTPFPLSTLVLNVTSQCNLACSYCYEYSEDRLTDASDTRRPRFMTDETARASVDFMLRESGDNPVARLTFFGGETLLNVPVLERTIRYARERADELGKHVEFSLTTNATLLKPAIIDLLVEHDVGVTISIDGPKHLQDQHRVFHDGTGSYDVVVPKIQELLRRHRRRPVGARVTLTSQVLDVRGIFRHLTEEIGFQEVGFAPVTTGGGRPQAIDGDGMDLMLAEFRALAHEFLEAAAENRHHAFTNVRDTLEELHKGASKPYPCGAGLGLLGVATDGEVGLCHRFAGSSAHRFGSVQEGLDCEVQTDFLERHHLDHKTDCRQCWARPICAGGCYHEAQIRQGSTTRPNLHFCEWIRGWTDVCLEVYGALAVRNPAYLTRFDG